MNVRLSEEQEMIRHSARTFLRKLRPPSSARKSVDDAGDCNEEHWHKMAGLGWHGLMVPEKYGGVDGSFTDLVVLFEEIGAVCLTGPFFATVVPGAMVLRESDDEKWAGKLLPDLAAGRMKITLACTGEDGSDDPATTRMTATSAKDIYTLSGSSLFVPDADLADFIVCTARCDGASGLSLFLVEGKAVEKHITVLKTTNGDKLCDVNFDGVQLPLDRRLGRPGDGGQVLAKVLRVATLAKCAEMVGAAQSVIDMTIPYTKERTQFGRPIGSFQAIQHHCANMLTDLNACRWVVYKTAWMMDRDMDCERQVSIAKAWCNEACRRIVALGHQVIGGISYCEEHDMPLYFRHARSAEVAWGDTAHHRDVIARSLFGS